MMILFLILIVIACVALGFVVLIQNPKGGGLAGNVGGFGNQVMGVKQTTDVLEKGTWIFAAAVAVLCLASLGFMGAKNEKVNKQLENVGTTGGGQQKVAPAPATPTPNGGSTTTMDTTKK
jgi:preprotein translocase subunit SecG